jgi:hypothetical protein
MFPSGLIGIILVTIKNGRYSGIAAHLNIAPIQYFKYKLVSGSS